MSQRIVFTGGGTAGHVTPNLVLIEILQKKGWQISYFGSKQGIEQEMLLPFNIPYYGISSGKLRRYFSWQNFVDPFKVLIGLGQAYRLLRLLNAQVVFSKGGFVALPVVLAAWLKRIPVIAHESDLSPGLANRLSFPFVNKMCFSFAVASQCFKNQTKIEVTGTPLREALFKGCKSRGLSLCDFNRARPCLLVMGGSQGSLKLNQILRESLPRLSQHYQIIHLCGKANLDASLLNWPNYRQFEYANQELADLFAASDFVISRAGANSLYEILALEKPHLLIPLPLKSSRGDQIQNALYFKQQGISRVLEEDALTSERFWLAIEELNQQKEEIIRRINGLHINELHIKSASLKIIDLIEKQIDI